MACRVSSKRLHCVDARDSKGLESRRPGEAQVGAACRFTRPHSLDGLLNSSVAHFVSTFQALNRRLRGHAVDTQIVTLVRDLDPDAFPTSEWRLLCEYVEASRSISRS